MNSIIIRKGEKKDAPAAHALIRELAIYEKAEEQHICTLEQFTKDGFDENPAYDLLVAELEGEVVGIALYFQIYSTWKGKSLYLDDLVVQEKHRRKGIGGKLFEALKQEAKAKKANHFGWQVLDWNEPAIQFYKKINAKIVEGWLNCKFTKEQIEQF